MSSWFLFKLWHSWNNPFHRFGMELTCPEIYWFIHTNRVRLWYWNDSQWSLAYYKLQPNSAIHQATGRTVPGFDWHNSCGMEKKPWMGERSLKTLPTSGWQSSSLVNSIVNVEVCIGVGFGVGQYEHTLHTLLRNLIWCPYHAWAMQYMFNQVIRLHVLFSFIVHFIGIICGTIMDNNPKMIPFLFQYLSHNVFLMAIFSLQQPWRTCF